MQVLNDSDIEDIPASVFVSAMTGFLLADFEGRATSPPRQAVAFPVGNIVYTTGGNECMAGFRAYETFDSSERIATEQLVAVWDTVTCELKGVCVGSRLGTIRTGVLGGIAVAALTPLSASRCALIGTGLQAETQLMGILAQRQLTQIRIYSRKQATRDAFLARMQKKTGIEIIASNTPEDAVSGADIAVLATDSTTPVVDPRALADVQHITTVGPKFNNAHELPLEVVNHRLIVSDSPQQIRAQGETHMLSKPQQETIRHLGERISRERGQEPKKSLYLSAGLAGTEVVTLAAALAYREFRSK